MDENQAEALVQVLGGSSWDSGGGIWLAVKERADGHVVALSDETACEYANWDELQGGTPLNTILLV